MSLNVTSSLSGYTSDNIKSTQLSILLASTTFHSMNAKRTWIHGRNGAQRIPVPSMPIYCTTFPHYASPLRPTIPTGSPPILPRTIMVNSVLRCPYQCKALRWSCPALDCGEWPLLEHLLGLLIHPHDGILGDAQEAGNQLVLAFHFFLEWGRPKAISLSGIHCF